MRERQTGVYFAGVRGNECVFVLRLLAVIQQSVAVCHWKAVAHMGDSASCITIQLCISYHSVPYHDCICVQTLIVKSNREDDLIRFTLLLHFAE